MDPVSLTASIIAILQLTATVLEYLNHVKNASTDRALIAIEASNVYSLLTTLRYRLEGANPTAPWFVGLQMLAAKNGALDQYEVALEKLASKFKTVNGLKNLGAALIWRFDKAEITEILARIERLKSSVNLALSNDHLYVYMISLS
jgi:hypothetical protein